MGAVISIALSNDAAEVANAIFNGPGVSVLDATFEKSFYDEDIVLGTRGSVGTFTNGPFGIGSGGILTSGYAKEPEDQGELMDEDTGIDGSLYCGTGSTTNAAVLSVDILVGAGYNGLSVEFVVGTDETLKDSADPIGIYLDDVQYALDTTGNRITVNSEYLQQPIGIKETGIFRSTFYDYSSAPLIMGIAASPGQHRMIFAICDANDGHRDSGLMVKASACVDCVHDIELNYATTTTTVGPTPFVSTVKATVNASGTVVYGVPEDATTTTAEMTSSTEEAYSTTTADATSHSAEPTTTTDFLSSTEALTSTQPTTTTEVVSTTTEVSSTEVSSTEVSSTEVSSTEDLSTEVPTTTEVTTSTEAMPTSAESSRIIETTTLTTAEDVSSATTEGSTTAELASTAEVSSTSNEDFTSTTNILSTSIEVSSTTVLPEATTASSEEVTTTTIGDSSTATDSTTTTAVFTSSDISGGSETSSTVQHDTTTTTATSEPTATSADVFTSSDSTSTESVVSDNWASTTAAATTTFSEVKFPTTTATHEGFTTIRRRCRP